MKQAGYLKRRTKIVCTIGPATGTVSVVERLIRNGMNVARLNLSHGTYDTHAKYIQTIRRISQRLGIQVAILIDLPGRKYRTGRLKNGQAILKKGAQVTFTTRDIEGDAALVPVNPPNLSQELKVGDTVLLDDGAMQLRVLEKNGGEVKGRVTVGGVLTERRGLVVPGMRADSPFITDALRENVAFSVQQNPDYLAISFISSAEDISALKAVLREHKPGETSAWTYRLSGYP
jgi:pyruvate kinase